MITLAGGGGLLLASGVPLVEGGVKAPLPVKDGPIAWRTITARVFWRTAVAKTFSRIQTGRVFTRTTFGENPLSAVPSVSLPKFAEEDRVFGFNFSYFPEISLELQTIRSADIPAIAGLTITNVAALAADFKDVGNVTIKAGKGVSAEIAGGTAGTSYSGRCDVTTSGGKVITVPFVITVQ